MRARGNGLGYSQKGFLEEVVLKHLQSNTWERKARRRELTLTRSQTKSALKQARQSLRVGLPFTKNLVGARNSAKWFAFVTSF